MALYAFDGTGSRDRHNNPPTGVARIGDAGREVGRF